MFGSSNTSSSGKTAPPAPQAMMEGVDPMLIPSGVAAIPTTTVTITTPEQLAALAPKPYYGYSTLMNLDHPKVSSSSSSSNSSSSSKSRRHDCWCPSPLIWIVVGVVVVVVVVVGSR